MTDSSAPLETTSPMTAKQETHREVEKSFLLSVIQPGLAGLMDRSVSSLAPLFCRCFGHTE